MIPFSDCVPRLLRSALSTALACAFFSATSAYAQSSAVEDLQRRLDDREKVISELIRRVEALERQLGGAQAAITPPPQEKLVATPGQQTQTNAGAPATELDEEQGARALERALVREGGLVLPRGVYEIEPAFTYRQRETQALTALAIGGQSSIALRSQRRDTLESSLALRIGLPWSSQLGVRVPYLASRTQLVVPGLEEQRSNRSGLGDIELAWTTQFMRERRALPSLLGTVSWAAPTGSFRLDSVNSPGSGFHVLQAGLTAVKRQDPMVFYGTVTQAWRLSRTISGLDIDPGDVTGFKVGTILAASPETSLRLALDVSRAGRTRVNGQKAPGTDASVGVLELGLGSLISGRTVLDFRVGIGLTPDAPNYRIDVALPVRFY
jgi:hypothetical protein